MELQITVHNNTLDFLLLLFRAFFVSGCIWFGCLVVCCCCCFCFLFCLVFLRERGLD